MYPFAPPNLYSRCPGWSAITFTRSLQIKYPGRNEGRQHKQADGIGDNAKQECQQGRKQQA